MKITIENISSENEEEIIIRTNNISEPMMRMIYALKAQTEKINGYINGSIVMLDPNKIYYFESVDSNTFAYCENSVYEIKEKLYELEEKYEGTDFFRSSKSTVLNLSKVERFTPVYNGRFEALLINGEKTVISRQYVSHLKKRLGL